MSFEMAFVFAILGIAFFLLVTERYPIDQVALAIPVVLLLAGVLNAEEDLILRGCWTPQREAGSWVACGPRDSSEDRTCRLNSTLTV